MPAEQDRSSLAFLAHRTTGFPPRLPASRKGGLRMCFSHVTLVLVPVLLTSVWVAGSRPATAAQGTEDRMVWSWTVPIPDSTSYGYEPHIGSDAQGNALAIWGQPLPPEGVQ